MLLQMVDFSRVQGFVLCTLSRQRELQGEPNKSIVFYMGF